MPSGSRITNFKASVGPIKFFLNGIAAFDLRPQGHHVVDFKGQTRESVSKGYRLFATHFIIPTTGPGLTCSDGSPFLRRMKKFLSLIVFFGLAAVSVQANPVLQNQWGVGVIAGEPTGLSVKKWLSEDRALDAAVAWSFEGNSSLHLHATYLFHDFELIQVERGAMPLYIGVGMRYKERSGRSDRLGVRTPVGVAYHFADNPIEVFAEVAPIFDFISGSRVVISGSIGFRFYFN